MSEEEVREVKEPCVFLLPHCRVKIGPLTEEWHCARNCVTPPHIFKQRDLIDTFELLFDGVTVMLNLKNGEVWFLPSGASPELQHKPNFPPETKFQLIWFRRMGCNDVPEFDKKTDPAELLFYGVGWQANVKGKNHKFGYIVDPKGDFYLGLPE